MLPATVIEVTLPVPIVYPIAKIPGPKPTTRAMSFLNGELMTWRSIGYLILNGYIARIQSQLYIERFCTSLINDFFDDMHLII